MTSFKDVGNGVFVPTQACVKRFGRKPGPCYRKLVNEYLMKVDESRSHWNNNVSLDEVVAISIPTGTQVIDAIRKKRYLTGADSAKAQLDQLAEGAKSVQGFGQTVVPPYPWERYAIAVVGGMALFLAVALFLMWRRRRLAA